MAEETTEVRLACANARCPVCRLAFKQATNIARLQCHHAVHLGCLGDAERCPICLEAFVSSGRAPPPQPAAFDSDDEEACASRIETLLSSGVSLDSIKNQAIASTLEGLRDLGLRRSHFVRYPSLASGPSLARFPAITAAKLLAYFGITERDSRAMFTDEQRSLFGYRR